MRTVNDLAEFDESPKVQHVNERIAYVCTYLETITSPSTKIYDIAGTDKSGTMLSGSTTLIGLVATTPLVIGVADGSRYRVVITATRSGNTITNYFWIIGAA